MNTSNPTCAICEKPILKHNDSNEHILPNAIGGRKKITGFICKVCNNSSGDAWEADLAQQLNPLSLLFDIKRDRGTPPAQLFQTTGGDSYKLHSDGTMSLPRPTYNTHTIENGVNIQIQARTMKEAKQQLQRAKKQFPQLDVEQLLSKAKEQATYCSDMLELSPSFGGHNTGRSIVKSALALVVEAGISHSTCEHAKGYLLEKGEEACFGYFYKRDVIANRPDGVPLHCVYVKGSPSTNQILGYVEFFGVYRLLLCLSSNYTGAGFENSYAIDPMNGTPLSLTFDFTATPAEIRDAYDYKAIPSGAVEEAFSRVIPTGQKRSAEQEAKRVSSRAVDHAISSLLEQGETELSKDNVNDFVGKLWEQILPFVLHQNTTPRTYSRTPNDDTGDDTSEK